MLIFTSCKELPCQLVLWVTVLRYCVRICVRCYNFLGYSAFYRSHTRSASTQVTHTNLILLYSINDRTLFGQSYQQQFDSHSFRNSFPWAKISHSPLFFHAVGEDNTCATFSIVVVQRHTSFHPVEELLMSPGRVCGNPQITCAVFGWLNLSCRYNSGTTILSYPKRAFPRASCLH